MKSPFPGMDPYLEQFWGDVHHRLITYAGDQLQAQLPKDLRARMEERVFVETDDGPHRSIYPDVHVVEKGRKPSESQPEARIATAEPLIIHLADEPVTQGLLEIVEVGSGNRIVTVIEFLSPSNKLPGEGQDLFLQKRREVQQAGASFVEIDLTRHGRRTLAVPEGRIPRSHRTTYQVCVTRGWRPKKYEVYRAPLDGPLPTIAVPLRETDADVALDLQALVDLCYKNGRYGDIDYAADPVPPLEAPDVTWANDLLQSAGRR